MGKIVESFLYSQGIFGRLAKCVLAAVITLGLSSGSSLAEVSDPEVSVFELSATIPGAASIGLVDQDSGYDFDMGTFRPSEEKQRSIDIPYWVSYVPEAHQIYLVALNQYGTPNADGPQFFCPDGSDSSNYFVINAVVKNGNSNTVINFSGSESGAQPYEGVVTPADGTLSELEDVLQVSVDTRGQHLRGGGRYTAKFQLVVKNM